MSIVKVQKKAQEIGNVRISETFPRQLSDNKESPTGGHLWLTEIQAQWLGLVPEGTQTFYGISSPIMRLLCWGDAPDYPSRVDYSKPGDKSRFEEEYRIFKGYPNKED